MGGSNVSDAAETARAGRALVLGGGGVAGIAWMTGLVAAWAGQGLALFADADLVVGTSAGASFAAQLGTHPIEELFGRQVDPVLQVREAVPATDPAAILPRMAEIAAQRDRRAALDSLFALSATSSSDPVPRRRVIEARLDGADWPEQRLLVTATGRQGRVVFTRGDVSLEEAVAASCAVPGVWPPVSIGGELFIDGGVVSSTNADLAAPFSTVLVLEPGVIPQRPSPAVEAVLRRALVVRPDEASQAAFGPNPLDASTREPAARAGRAQGIATCEEVRVFWRGGPDRDC